MYAIPLKMLLKTPGRMLATGVGLGTAFFLTAAQVGLLVGWCNTTTAIVRNAGVDLWVMARETSSFDYGSPIPEERIFQARSVPGVAQAEGMIMTWVFWRRPDGRHMTVELVGLDRELVGGPWRMQAGEVADVYQPDGVIVDALYCDALGVRGLGDEVEVLGSRAIVRGISQEVRTFTAAPFVFTSRKSAVKYDMYYKHDQVTYVLVRCKPGADIETTRKALQTNIPSVEVLTTRDFALRTIRYWMLETGVGITVVTTAVLGLVIGAVIASQSLYAMTQDHLAHYATLLALGFRRWHLACMVICQGLFLGILGIVLGIGPFFYAVRVSTGTPIPIETTPVILVIIVATTLLSCTCASLLALRSLWRIDPVVVFRN